VRSPTFRSFCPLSALTFFVLLLVALVMAQPARADKDLTVKLPAAGEYQVWLEAETASGSQAQAPELVTSDRASLSLPAAPPGLKEWRVLALDEKSGYVAVQTLPAKNAPAEVSFTPPEFNRVHRVRVQVTGAGAKPVAGASVTLTDAKASTLSKVIDASAAGVAEFIDVASGAAKLTVTPTGGKSTTKEVDINLPKGETTEQIAVPLPEVTAVVEAPAGVSPAGTPATSGEQPGEGKGTTGAKSGSAGTTEGTGTSTSSPAPAPAPAPAPSGGGLGSAVGLILVLGLLGYAYLHLKNQGWTLDKFLARLGVQPTAATPAGTGLGTPAPAPPPVDPNVCPFCGQRKDPVTGACACSLDVPASAGGGLMGPALALTGSGPRLVAVSGLAMGQIFPIGGEATIGRDPGNTVSLSMDSTVSRRHAVIGPGEGGFVIRDQGSSNGTFVNGAKVTEAPLRPGDELSIGGTRFRFEA
jgi:FHA domain-containing protein